MRVAPLGQLLEPTFPHALRMVKHRPRGPRTGSNASVSHTTVVPCEPGTGPIKIGGRSLFPAPVIHRI